MKPMNTINEQLSVGEIVSQNYQAAGLLRSYDIDFCCGGGISLAEACRRKGVDLGEVTQRLTSLSGQPGVTNENYESWSMSLLMQYIVETHHSYVRAKVDELMAFTAKVARRHGEHHPENVEIFQIMSDLVPELLTHLESEEDRVFPLIKKLEYCLKNQQRLPAELVSDLRREFAGMEEEHEGAGAAMRKIRELSNNFTPPAEACATWQVLYKSLDEFEQDLHKHVHLENNILFKKAAAALA